MNRSFDPDWDQLVNENAQRVFAVAMRILGCVHEAEDASQEAFAQAFQFPKHPPVNCWTGLLVRLTTMRSLDRLRKRNSKQHSAHPLREGDKSVKNDPADGLVADELRGQLLTALLRVPEQQASVFWMIAIEQLSRDEVASALHLSVEAVSTALYKARKSLSVELGSYCLGGKS